MAELHDLLERESERYTLPIGAADRMFERGRRRSRNRRLAALALGAILFAAVLAIARAALPGGDESKPAVPDPVTPESLAGTYTVELNRDDDPDVRGLHLQGAFEMRLDRDGSMQLTSPKGFDLPGTPITFTIDAGVMTTDALVGAGCEAPGTVPREPRGRDPLVQARRRDLRAPTRPALLASLDRRRRRPADRLEGDWTATFSCERMVHTVQEAPVAPAVAHLLDGGHGDRARVRRSVGSLQLGHGADGVHAPVLQRPVVDLRLQ